jgi:hypothetical protein
MYSAQISNLTSAAIFFFLGGANTSMYLVPSFPNEENEDKVGFGNVAVT